MGNSVIWKLLWSIFIANLDFSSTAGKCEDLHYASFCLSTAIETQEH